MAKVIKKSNVSGIIFLVGLITITLFIVIFTVITVGKPFVIDKVEDIKDVTVENYKTANKTQKEYYVYVYNKASFKDEMLKDIILEYANYARTNSDALPIYVMNYQTNTSITNSGNLNISSSNIETYIPALVYIKNGSISSTQKTVSTIKNTLVQAMGK